MIGKLVVSCAMIALSGMAVADTEEAARVDLAELKDKCRQLSDNPQIEPFTVRVTCREKVFTWKEATPAAIELANQREVGASLAMKNFHVAYQGSAQQVPNTQANCTVLEKWERLIQGVDVELSCEQLYEIDDVAAYCAPIIDQRLAEDAGIATETRTSESYDTCRGAGLNN